MKRNILFCCQIMAVALLLLSSCVSHPAVPSESKTTNSLPDIYPDYCDVTIPCNIAPLNFMLPDVAYDKCVARITTPDCKQCTDGY